MGLNQREDNMDRKIMVLMGMVVLLSSVAITAYAADTSSSSSSWGSTEETKSDEKKTSEKSPAAVSLYDQGVEASKNNDFEKALTLFEQALQRDRNNPDILNMLAHTQRKLGKIDESLENYKKALALRPKFPEAREYLGEAYLQAALREIKTLKDYGNEGAESREDLTKAFKEAAAKLE